MGRLAQQFKTKVSLAMVGSIDKENREKWQEAYIEMAPLTVKALPELSGLSVDREQSKLDGEQLASLIPLLQKSFISGMVVVDGELVPAEASDLEDLPLEAANALISTALGQPDPKS